MIASPQNEKLKLVRKLRERKHREREGLFVTEGEDLLDAARAAGVEPEILLTAAGSGLGGEEVEPDLLGLGLRRSARAPGRSASGSGAGPTRSRAPCVYLHGVGDPGNVGAIVRTAHALIDGSVVLGPDCADPFSPKAARASMGSLFARPPARGGLDATPAPRAALVAHGGESPATLATARTLCLGAEREGLPAEVLESCETEVTIPLRGAGAESLNVAAAAAIGCQWISSPAMREARPDA